ncbi:GL24938 [Drosophila persimilis]|uniref:GL24938 n=1 Tax=Drosophila persimilis TaxID=7234 RepID=B4GRH1_DROPE|nr:GL24938 [Drosophila persimilis]
MELPKELSIAEIRNYMLVNECKVTNHALVKHFKKFLTHPQSQNEARRRFKTYVTLLSTIKNENNQKFLILRKKYLNECPTDEAVERAVAAANNGPEPSSPGGGSITFEGGSLASPMRQPPPYKPPPMVTSPSAGVAVHKVQQDNYRECVDEFTAAIQRIDPARLERQPATKTEEDAATSQEQPPSVSGSVSRSNSVDETGNKENIPRFSFSSGASTDSSAAEKVSSNEADTAENPMSVKEATRKFNRMASEEEAKIISPPAKKKPEKTALHWAAKHGNEDVVKLIAGTYKADVNAKTGYTPLHLATQFGRDNIFELLWNVYKANRDIMDWSGNKPLDYSRQRPSVSASTCSKIKARKKHTIEKDLGFLRIGSLNVRVKKTTEAFSNFLGVGNGSGVAPTGYGSGGATTANRPHQRSHQHPHQRHHHHVGTTRSRHPNQRVATTPYGTNSIPGSRASVPNNRNIYDVVHKSWGSADNITQRTEDLMPPPKSVETKRNKSSKRSSYASNATNSPRDSICSSNSSSNLNSGYSSMPTTPNQVRAPKGMDHTSFTADSDSDSACGFDSSWSVSHLAAVGNNPTQS